MHESHIELIEQQVIDNIICNCCGREIKKHEGHISTMIDWLYANKIFSENTYHRFEICEECYAEWLKSFKFAPSGFQGCYEYEDSQIEFEKWKKNFNK